MSEFIRQMISQAQAAVDNPTPQIPVVKAAKKKHKAVDTTLDVGSIDLTFETSKCDTSDATAKKTLVLKVSKVTKKRKLDEIDGISQENAEKNREAKKPKSDKLDKPRKPRSSKVKPVKVVHIETIHDWLYPIPLRDEVETLKVNLIKLTGDPVMQQKTWKAHMLQYAVVDSMYSIPLVYFGLVPHINSNDVKRKCTFEIAEAFVGDGVGNVKRETFQETEHWFRVPRQCGIELWGLPTGLFGIQTTLGDAINPELKFAGEISETALRPQQSADKAIRDQLAKELGGVMVLPCGCGKTRTATFSCLKLGRKVLWIVGMQKLMSQAKQAFQENIPGIKVGWIQEDRCEIEGMDVVVASEMTLLARKFSDKDRNSFGTLVIDECHRLASPAYSTIIERFPAHNRIGLTATPRRRDGTADIIFQHLGKIAFKCERPPQKVQVHCITYLNKRNEKEIKCANKNFAYTLLKKRLMYDWKRNNVIVDQIIKCSLEGRRVIVFLEYHDHIDKIIKSLEIRTNNWKRPLDVVEYTGRVTKKERDDKLNHACILTLPGMMREGVDATGFDTIVYGYLQGDLEQSAGRILRTEIENMENVPKILYLKEPYGILGGLANKAWRFFTKLGYEFTYEKIEVPQEDESESESDQDSESEHQKKKPRITSEFSFF